LSSLKKIKENLKKKKVEEESGPLPYYKLCPGASSLRKNKKQKTKLKNFFFLLVVCMCVECV
jgi:hypothetical protein